MWRKRDGDDSHALPLHGENGAIGKDACSVATVTDAPAVTSACGDQTGAKDRAACQLGRDGEDGAPGAPGAGGWGGHLTEAGVGRRVRWPRRYGSARPRGGGWGGGSAGGPSIGIAYVDDKHLTLDHLTFEIGPGGPLCPITYAADGKDTSFPALFASMM
ncbi:hypothetical protein WME79_36475 [Sorangium sp. So ce726]|uniref:hypothetical protein n=1 Tax=Sorangium sp. So ce726 TaxID=3133319 RepID=UPI003F6038EB